MKWIWTDEDFNEMQWHDVRVHAMAFVPENHELVLDIDYVFEWMPQGEGKKFLFSISPATLVFENVYNIRIDLEMDGDIDIDLIERKDPGTARNAQYTDNKQEWTWTVECHTGEIEFRGAGFKQYIRREPVVQDKLRFSMDERGGHSFIRGKDNET